MLSRCILSREARVVHVAGIGGLVAAQRAQKWEYMLADDGVHFAGFHVLEARPAQVGLVPNTINLIANVAGEYREVARVRLRIAAAFS